MTSQLIFRIFCLLAIVLAQVSPNVIQAQVDQIKPAVDVSQKEKEAEQQKELEKKTLALLNEVASASWTLKLPENRLFVMSSAAEMLWTFDEKRARTLYWDALNSLNLIASPVAIRGTVESLSRAEREKLQQSYFSLYSLRQKLLWHVAQRDAQLALEMLRATRQVPPRQLGPEYYFPDDLQLEQEIASNIAARDPAQALQIARQSLAKGVTIALINLLHKINEKDPEKASQFAGEIIAKLRTISVATDFYASTVAVHMLQSSRVPDGNRKAVLSPGGGSLRLSDDQKKDLVEILTNAALTTGTQVAVQLLVVMPEIEQFFPERRAAVAKKQASFNTRMIGGQRIDNNVVVDLSSTPEELVRTANMAASADVRLMLFQNAAMVAVARGTTDAFRELADKEITNADERMKVFDAMTAEEINVAVARKQPDQLQKLLTRIRSKEDRARAMAEMALLLKEKGEHEEASALLDEAASLIKTDLKDEKQTNALLALLFAYAVVDPPKAFALAERTVDQANNQISLLTLVDKVIRSGMIKKNEIILEQDRLMPIDFMVFKYGKGVAALAKADFNRTKALAQRFERNELKLMAQLLVLRGLLQPEPLVALNPN